MNVGQVQQVLEAARPDAVSPQMKQGLQELWPTHSEALLQALEARMRERTSGLQKFLAERAEKEMSDITTILTELRRTILAELRQPEVVQLQLAGFSMAEREQFERNMSALAERAEQIDAEIEKERTNIRRRFADPQPGLLPLAVTYLVPARTPR